MNTLEAEVDSELDVIKEVNIDNIIVSPYQPRKMFDQDELEALAASIKSVGLIHPPLVRPSPTRDNFYEIISGERRLRAATLAGLKQISVVVKQAPNNLSAEAALIENLQRVDLNPMEIAQAFQQLMDQFNLGQEELAVRMGKKRSSVANYLRLLTLPQTIRDSLSNGFITMGHAKAILSLNDSDKQHLLHEMILRDDLSVRTTELAATKLSNKPKKAIPKYVDRNFYLEQLSERLQHKLGTKVVINGTNVRGRITMDYYSLDDLERLLSHIDSKLNSL